MATGNSRIADMVDTVHHEYGCCLCQNSECYELKIKMQVFMKLTGIYDHIAIYKLVFTHDTGIYA